MTCRRPLPWSLLAVVAVAVACGMPLAAQAQVPNEPPRTEIDHPGDGAVVGGLVNVTGTASDTDGEVERVEVRVNDGEWREANGTSSWHIAWNTTLWSSGEHELTARAYDGADYSENATVNVTVDQAPDVTLEAPLEGGTVEGTVTVNGTAQDPESSLENVTVHVDDGPRRDANGTADWSFAWNTTGVSEGEHTVVVRADDGNTTAQDVVNVTVDNKAPQPPSVAIETPEEGATVDGVVDVAGVAHDPEGPLEQVEVRIDDGPWRAAEGTSDWSLAWNTTEFSEGEHTVVARADDGDRTGRDVVNVTVDNGEGATDVDTPTVEITAPPPSAEVSGSVAIEGTADNPNGSIDRVEVRIDGGPWQAAEGTSSWTYTWNASGVEEGEHTLGARALSETHASPVDDVTVDVTRSAPEGATVRILEPANGTTVGTEVVLDGIVEGPTEEVSGVEVRVDHSPWTPVQGVADWTRTLDVSGIEPGDHRIWARALDGGETTSRAWIRVTLGAEELEATGANGSTGEQDGTPVLDLSSPQAKTTVETPLVFSGTVTDPDDGSLRAEIRIDGGPWRSIEVDSGEQFRSEIPVDHLEPGDHQIAVRATDGIHTSSRETFQVTVEETYPVPAPGIATVLAALVASAVAARLPDAWAWRPPSVREP